MIKRLFLATIFVLTFLSFFNSNKVFAALDDCVCETITTQGGSKDCKPKAGTACSTGNQPFCIINIDGGCNHALFTAGSCRCISTSVPLYYESVLPTYPTEVFNTGKPGIVNINSSNLGSLISSLFPYVFGSAGLILFIMLIWGGITLMTAAGDPAKSKSGYGKISAGLIGFLIIFISYFVTQIVEVVLGIKIL